MERYHYESVRDSLIWALANTLGAERWTKEIEQSVSWVIDRAQGAGAMLGPAVAGGLIFLGGYTGLLILASMAILVASIVFTRISRNLPRGFPITT